MDYEIIKSLHMLAVTVFVIGMIASILTLMRIANSPIAERVAAAKKAHLFILRPTSIAITIVWLLGGWMIWTAGFIGEHWLWAKLVLVMVVSGIHGVAAKQLRYAKREEHVIAGKLPISLLVFLLSICLILYLVFAKPF